MKVAIHQPNFCPHFPFFYKMAMADIFVILDTVQFEKNGWQNRCKVWEKWWTCPVNQGTEYIYRKKYINDFSLVDVNMHWIEAIRKTLGIRTQIEFTRESAIANFVRTEHTVQKRDPTGKLVGIVKEKGGTVYITNPDAKGKYLDEEYMKSQGIEIEYCKVPKHLQIHVFEAFNKWGIEGTIKQLPRRGNEKSVKMEMC